MASLSPCLLQGCERATERLLALDTHYRIQSRRVKSACSPKNCKYKISAQNWNGELTLRAATLLVFLTGTAWAGIVATHFRPTAHDLLHLPVACTSHTRLLEFAALASLERFFKIIY